MEVGRVNIKAVGDINDLLVLGPPREDAFVAGDHGNCWVHLGRSVWVGRWVDIDPACSVNDEGERA